MTCGVVVCGGAATADGPDAAPPPPPREFRGVWIATVANIDWPSRPGIPARQQQEELRALLDRAAELRFNAVIFQVRPMADALYASQLEPWSEFLTGQLGRDPGYDPLAFAVQEAHARGLELHAWFNPYRAWHPSARSAAPPEHLIRRRPDLAKPYGKHHWLNPTHPDVSAHTLAVIVDVVRRYDIDGVHIDDYFYPYKERDAAGRIIPFPDEDTWEQYRRQGGSLGRDDWRRAAVNRFVRELYAAVKVVKPWVKVGISPFGIWRPGHPEGIAGLDQFAELYADPKLWLNEGWCDYMAPQLYWAIDSPRQSFPKLLAWWAGENVRRRHLWPGLYTSRVGAKGGWPAREIAEQVRLTRRQAGVSGAIHFSIRALRDNPDGLAEQLQKVYAAPALVPEISWSASGPPPRPPRLERRPASGKPQEVVVLLPPEEARWVLLRRRQAGGWTWELHPARREEGLTVAADPAAPAWAATIDRHGRISPWLRCDGQ